MPGLALAHPERVSPRAGRSRALSALTLLLCPPGLFCLSPGSPDPLYPLTLPCPLASSFSHSGLFAGFPVHGVRGATPRRPCSTPLPAGPAGGPHLPAPAQTRLRPGKLVGLTSVDTWLTQGSVRCLGPSCGGPAREALAADGRGIGRHSSSSSPWDHLLLRSPGPRCGGEGQGQGRAVDGGLWSPHCPGGSSRSNCRRHPALGLRHLKDFSAIYCSYC